MSTKQNSSAKLTVVCFADSHEAHREIDMPSGDVLIFAGDASLFSKSEAAICDFAEWLNDLPHPVKLFVPGNHDAFILDERYKRRFERVEVLIDRGLSVAGLNIWGSPTTMHSRDPFGIPSAEARRIRWQMTPEETLILVSHCPPFGILDRPDGSAYNQGDPELLAIVQARSPSLHVFGHVHGPHGTMRLERTLFANCTCAGTDGQLVHQPLVFSFRRQSES